MKVRFTIFAAVVLTLYSCAKEEMVSDQVTRLAVIQGGNRTVPQNQKLDAPIIVKAFSENGHVEGVNIMAQVTEGNAKLDSRQATTDASGQASFEVTIDTEAFNEITFSLVEDPEISVVTSFKTSYTYRMPIRGSDGIEVDSLTSHSLNPRGVYNALDQIRWGNYTEIHSVLIFRDDKLLVEEYFPGHDSNGNYVNHTASTKHEVQSASKSFRSMLIGIAIDEGLIDSEEVPLFSFFDEYFNYASGGKENITLHHVLTMSSGLQWDEGSGNSLSVMYNMPYNKWVEYVLSKPLMFAPGTRWVYNTGASIMLNNIIINSMEMDFSEFVSDYYVKKVQSISLPGVGNPLGATTTPRDMAKIGLVYLNDGMWKDTRVVSKSWVDKSLQPWFNVATNRAYGYQWWIRELQSPRNKYTSYSAEGNGGQFVIFIKELDLVVVFTGGHFGSNAMFRSFELLTDYIIPAFE